MSKHSSISGFKKQISEFKNIIRDIPGCIYWKDKNSIYLGCNHEFLEMTGLQTEQQIIGKTDRDLCWKGQAETLFNHDQSVIKNGQTSILEEEVSLADGTKKLYSVIKSPLRNERNEIIGIVGTSIDITYRKIMEEKLKEAIERAEEANRSKSEFIANMEHDIRTPFCGVWGLAKQLYEIEQDPLKKELLADISACANELLDYCNTILDFSRIESGTLPVTEKKFDLKKLIASIMAIETPPAKSGGLTLNLEYDEAISPILIGDPYRLHRILINLIGNSIKFTKKGAVALSVKLVSMQKSDRSAIIRFSVHDTGIGIPEDRQNYIFEKFTRLMPSNRGLYQGAGFGLTIVKQFVKEMGGEIDLQSEVDRGSIFMCTFPFKIPLVGDLFNSQ